MDPAKATQVCQVCFVSGGNGVDAEHGESPFQIVFVSFRDR